jgi:hypothetical protein
MVWLLWQKPVAQELSDQVKERLIAKFALDSRMVDKMRFSGKKGRYSDRPVKYIRIYDPGLIKESESAAPSYDGLVQISDNRAALLFDGRIESNERVYLTDQRTPAALFPL